MLISRYNLSLKTPSFQMESNRRCKSMVYAFAQRSTGSQLNWKCYSLMVLYLFVGLILTPVFDRAIGQENYSFRSEEVATGQAKTTLIAEGPLVPGEVTWFALEQKLAEHWHVYWKNPGDSGLPLVMNWTLPEGYHAGDIQYPVPNRIPVGPLVNFGYEGVPTFLIPVTTPPSAKPGEIITLSVQAGWLICEEVCIPEDAEFTIKVPVEAEFVATPKNYISFEVGSGHLPATYDGVAKFSSHGEEIFLYTDINTEGAKDIFFFAQGEGYVVSAAEQGVLSQAGGTTLKLKKDFAFKDEIDTLDGVLTFETAGGAMRDYAFSAQRDNSLLAALPASFTGISASTSRSDADNVSENTSVQSAIGLPLLMLMAFFGGIILNVMPCVFPILFIKASALMNSAQESRATIRLYGWLYTAGVMVTFAAIGGLLLILRAGGESLGWGFHLQSPIIVLASSYVLLLVGLNLAGMFEVGTSLQGVGQGLTAKQGGWGSFFTGALAVLVAAPCIGPLLSAPMGAAVLLPPVWGMLLFLLMAFGLAFPYLILSLVPGLGRALPKPGAWMDIMKQALSFPVFAAAAYFLWVLAAQTGPGGLAIGLIGALLIAIAAWLYGLSNKGGIRQWLLRAICVVLVLGALLQTRGLQPVSDVSFADNSDGATHGSISGAIAFDQEKIVSLNGLGQDVFVDFTAAWCVTCQFNKLTVFSSNDVANAFKENNTQFMVADWTVRDEKITAALSAFDRNGVPLYVYYPADGEPEILKLPLTERAVIKTLSGD